MLPGDGFGSVQQAAALLLEEVHGAFRLMKKSLRDFFLRFSTFLAPSFARFVRILLNAVNHAIQMFIGNLTEVGLVVER